MSQYVQRHDSWKLQMFGAVALGAFRSSGDRVAGASRSSLGWSLSEALGQGFRH